jgi:hypothetical protein
LTCSLLDYSLIVFVISVPFSIYKVLLETSKLPTPEKPTWTKFEREVLTTEVQPELDEPMSSTRTRRPTVRYDPSEAETNRPWSDKEVWLFAFL